MTHIITSLCLRDSGCVDVCPVECIVPGKPQEEWPWFYIDPDTPLKPSSLKMKSPQRIPPGAANIRVWWALPVIMRALTITVTLSAWTRYASLKPARWLI